ncbi:HD domain-containing protein [Sediminicola luteus]|uniref:Phosphohydrolase n=1 Tax=Sediminicola luteus TaxID=319238 RepID=A0A2A4GCX8_9FLAO|nr:HD domain-containing protein [Sediminicola luteus]PCE66467.1 phosphohydrolase [Sediminicola luteus]
MAGQLIEKTIAFVKETLAGAEGGHDWFHIQRVYNNSQMIAAQETGRFDAEVVALGALLHDIADAKFHQGDETVGPRVARTFLEGQGVAEAKIAQVVYIIEHISFKNSLAKGYTEGDTPLELQIVRDADRLDAIGAIGIGRAFNYGGFKNRPMHDPDIAPNLDMDKEAYKKSNAPTINHFYEKLLLLKDRMHTESGKRLAQARHEYMQGFLDQFYAEWDGKK